MPVWQTNLLAGPRASRVSLCTALLVANANLRKGTVVSQASSGHFVGRPSGDSSDPQVGRTRH